MIMVNEMSNSHSENMTSPEVKSPLPFTIFWGQRYAKNMGHRLQGLVKADEATLEQEMRGLSKRTPWVVKPGNGKSVNHCGL